MNRPTLSDARQSLVVQGDTTTHGGVVTSGSAAFKWNGVPVARVGDLTFCPKCKPHIFPIVEGHPTQNNSGLPLAHHGHATACGAALIAQSAPLNQFDESLFYMSGVGFDDRYVLTDANGQPMANTYYASATRDGHIEYGTTDEQGHTHLHLSGENAAEIDCYIAG